MNIVSVMIAEDNEIYRLGLAGLLCEVPGVAITGTAVDGAGLLRIARDNPPDLVFTDIQMPVLDGISLTTLLTKEYPAIKVIALTQYVSEHLVSQMIAAGAKGYMEKNSAVAELSRAIDYVMAGNHYYSPQATAQLVQLASKGAVKHTSTYLRQLYSEKEVAIIRLICAGYLTKQIAPEVHLSEVAVEKHRSKIMEKAGVKTLVGLVVYGARHGFCDG